MTWLWEWVLNIPVYVSNVVDWLTTDITIGDATFTPLAIVGASAGAFLAVVIALKIKSLIIV